MHDMTVSVVGMPYSFYQLLNMRSEDDIRDLAGWLMLADLQRCWFMRKLPIKKWMKSKWDVITSQKVMFKEDQL